jgi:RHS repeat-associated protein
MQGQVATRNHRAAEPTPHRAYQDHARYDANGNMTQMPLMTMSYDVANRMVSSDHSSQGVTTYRYNHANQRIYMKTGTKISYFLYGPGGERLLEMEEQCGGNCWNYQETQRWIYFAGRKMFSKTGTTLKAITPNRLASEAKHFPYGETDGPPPADTKDYFATYRRDTTGLDYAWNRYYSPTMGRFTTADPYEASAALTDPQTWNRYGYVGDDPVNGTDRTGLLRDICEDPADGGPNCFRNRYNPFANWYIVTTFDSDGYPSGLSQGWIGGYQAPEGGSGGGGTNRSQFPPCNPSGNPITEKKLNFIAANYEGARQIAETINSQIPQSGEGRPLNHVSEIAKMFLQWSAWESGWMSGAREQAQNNFFGMQQGSWGGTTVPCPAGVGSTTNACFPQEFGFGQQLTVALAKVPHTSSNSNIGGLTYGQFLVQALTGLKRGSDLATIGLQAIADAGWNVNKSYGKTISSGVGISGAMDCMKANGYIK